MKQKYVSKYGAITKSDNDDFNSYLVEPRGYKLISYNLQVITFDNNEKIIGFFIFKRKNFLERIFS